MRKHIIIFSLFFSLSFIFLYPIPVKLSAGIHGSINNYKENGDSLFSLWAMSHHLDRITQLNFRDYWNSNIFYPYEDYLLLNEHHLGSALLVLPFYFFYRDYLTVYNINIFLSFLLSAYFTFILIEYLTKNTLCGFLGGVIFAYNSYHIAHLSHPFLISTQWIPLIFLFAHKMKDEKSKLNPILFAFFYFAQSISSLYYTLMINIFLFTLFIWLIFTIDRGLRKEFIKRLLFSMALLIILVLPYFLFLLSMKKKYNFDRSINEVMTLSADLSHFLSTFPHNVFYSKFLLNLKLFSLEGVLFPGLVPVLVLLTAVFIKLKNVESKQQLYLTYNRKKYPLSLFSGIFFLLLLAYYTLLKIKQPIWEFSYIYTKKQDLLICSLLIVVFFCFLCTLKKIFTCICQYKNDNFFIYLIISLIAVFLCMGPIIMYYGHQIAYGPFLILYKIPIFSGIRAVARFYIFALLGLSVMSAFSLRYLIQKYGKLRYFFPLLPFLVFCESIVYPIDFAPVEKYDNIPAVYKWLSSEQKETVILETPLKSYFSKDGMFLYYSMYHKKKIINGYGGWSPWLFSEISKQYFNNANKFIQLIKKSNTNLVLFHSDYQIENIDSDDQRILALLKNYEVLNHIEDVIVFSSSDVRLEFDVSSKKKLKSQVNKLYECIDDNESTGSIVNCSIISWESFYPPEKTKYDRIGRWFGQSASVIIDSSEECEKVCFVLKTFPFKNERNLRISFNDGNSKEYRVTSQPRYVILSGNKIKKGRNILKFESLSTADKIDDVLKNNDTRTVSFMIYDLYIIKQK